MMKRIITVFICVVMLAVPAFCGDKCGVKKDRMTDSTHEGAAEETEEFTLNTDEEKEIITYLDLLENYDILLQLDMLQDYDSLSLGGEEEDEGGEN